MKKSLIALAVAGIFAAPAFAATGNVDVYGKLRFSTDYVDTDGVGAAWMISDRVSRLGFKGSEDLGGGLKAVWQIEQGLSIDAANAGAAGAAATKEVANRNSFVGLAGDFGTVLMGRHDTPYKLAGSADLFGDTIADSQDTAGIIGANGFDTRVQNTLAYISPTFSGFHFAAAVVPGEAAGTNTDGLMDAYSLAAIYGNGPLKVTAALEDYGDVRTDDNAWKINASYSISGINLGATYENQDFGGGVESTNWLISAAYAMGPITLAAQYGDRDHDTVALKKDRLVVGAIYALSKRTNAALAYMSDDNGGAVADVSGWTLQLNHDF